MNQPIIIDTHMHLGRSSISGVENTLDELLLSMEKNRIAHGFIIPQASQFQDVFEVHSKIHDAQMKYPELFRGIMCVNPRLGEDIYYGEAEKCFNDYKFIGIKLDPNIHAVPIDSRLAELVFETAEKFAVPVIIHTGAGIYSNPALAITMAMKYPGVKIVLAHSGMLTYASEAVMAAQICENVFLECSWSATMHMQKMLATVGSGKMMFGSDHISNLPVEIEKLHALKLSPEQIDDISFKTAQKVFNVDF